MAIEFVCPACGGALQVGDESAGRVIRCGGCMTALRVPAPDPAPGPSHPPSPFETDQPAPRRSSGPPADVEPIPDDALPTARRVDSRPPGDRPRRARRRRTPPPARGGALVWVLVLGGLGLLGLFGCCGGLVVSMSKPKWHTHVSEKGGFEVELPAPVRPDAVKQAQMILEPGERAEGALLPLAGQQYLVIYKDIPGTKDRAAKNEKSDRDEIDGMITHMFQNFPEAKPHSDKSMSVDGFPAREIEIGCPTGVYIVRIVLADTRVYTLMVHGAEAPNGDDARRFIDSFKITDEKLVKEGKAREADAAKAKEREDRRRADATDEQKRRADADRKRREQETPDAGRRDLGRAARTVTELGLGVAAEATDP